MDRKIRKVSWNEFNRYVESLAFIIRDIMNCDDSELVLDYVYGVPRGGCIPAVMISHLLDLEYLPELQFDSDWDRILVVDDIIDSGDTISSYVEHLHCVSIFYREGAYFSPMTYAAKLEDDTWIQFPWEKQVNDKFSSVNFYN